MIEEDEEFDQIMQEVLEAIRKAKEALKRFEEQQGKCGTDTDSRSS